MKIVVIDAGYDSYKPERDLLSRYGYSLSVFEGARHDIAGKLKLARDAVGLFVRWTAVNESFLSQLSQLCAIRVSWCVSFSYNRTVLFQM